MNSIITIGGLVFRNQVNSVSIESTWKQLTQKAVVKLPRFKKLVDENEDQYKINVGDPVTIQLGYDDTMNTEFTGYVSSRSYNSPLAFECEDEMWQLKQVTISKSYATVKLKDLVSELIPGTDVSQVQDITITNLRINRATIAEALQQLNDKYGLIAYYRDKQLFAGLPYTETGLKSSFCHFQKNLPKNQSSLEYKLKDDLRIRVRAISMLKTNKTIEVELGDQKGDASETTMHFYNLNEAELRKQAEIKMNLLKYTGYRGTLTTFGLPFTRHTEVVTITDNKYPERNGKYFIDGVKVTYGAEGYRRALQLGRRFDIQ